MPVIAMTREMGSRGREVAQGLADKLGLTLVLHELVEHDLAEHLHVPESAIHHRFEGGASLRERWTIGTKRLAKYTAEEILDLARKGNVLIRGWGACVVLRDVPHVARVRVCAPLELRERNIMQRRCLKDMSAARREIEPNDAAHKQALQAAYGVDREDALVYDLVLNTERFSIETCVKLVGDLVETRSSRRPRPRAPSSRTRCWKPTFASSFANASRPERASATSGRRFTPARSSCTASPFTPRWCRRRASSSAPSRA